MSPHKTPKLYVKSRIGIVKENLGHESSGPDEPNRSNELNENTLHKKVVLKYLQSLLKPMNMMQALFVCARYKIQNDVITPNSHRYSVLSVCASIILTTTIYIMFFKYPNTSQPAVFADFLVCIYDFLLYFIGCFLDTFNNIKQRLNNVLFVLKIQNVHRILKLNVRSFMNFTISNWVSVITIHCFHLFWILMSFHIFTEICVFNTLASYICVRFDMNIIYATRSMKLVHESLKSWIEELRKSRHTDDLEDEQYTDSMSECFTDMIQVFELVEKTFNRLVLFYSVHTCCSSLMDIWARIEMKTPDYGDVQYALLTCMTLTWVLKNLILLSSLSVECERFYSAMSEVQSSCIQMITSGRCSDTGKRFCKNIQRVQSATFKKMNVCGLFTIDAAMLMQLLGVLTTYTIVILQFEFLK